VSILKRLHDAVLISVFRFAYSDGFNSSPLPFPCSITPRSPERAEVIRLEKKAAEAELERYTVSPTKRGW